MTRNEVEHRMLQRIHIVVHPGEAEVMLTALQQYQWQVWDSPDKLITEKVIRKVKEVITTWLDVAH